MHILRAQPDVERSGLLHRSVSLTAGQLEPGTSYPGMAREPAVYRWPGPQPGTRHAAKDMWVPQSGRFLGFFGAVRFLIAIV